MHLILIVIVVAVVLYILFKAAKVMIQVVAVLAILLAAYFTNPDIDDHRDAVTKKAAADNTTVERNTIKIRDWKVMSVTEGENGIIGIGAFTKVWIFRL